MILPSASLSLSGAVAADAPDAPTWRGVLLAPEVEEKAEVSWVAAISSVEAVVDRRRMRSVVGRDVDWRYAIFREERVCTAK